MLLYQQYHIVKETLVDGETDVENLIEAYPVEIQKAIDEMTKQNLHLIWMADSDLLLVTYEKNNSSKQIRAALHADVGGYLTVLENEFYTHTGLALSPDQVIDYIIDMENTLFASKNQDTIYYHLAYSYSVPIVFQ